MNFKGVHSYHEKDLDCFVPRNDGSRKFKVEPVYIEAMGGELVLIAKFPDVSVKIDQFDHLN